MKETPKLCLKQLENDLNMEQIKANKLTTNQQWKRLKEAKELNDQKWFWFTKLINIYWNERQFNSSKEHPVKDKITKKIDQWGDELLNSIKVKGGWGAHYSVLTFVKAMSCTNNKDNHYVHSVWKSPKMSHLNFWILAFSTNFCPIKIDLSGKTVWPQASGFKNSSKSNICAFLINLYSLKM